MRRTRKWAFVAQEAGRLTRLGLSPKDIAARLEVNKSTVTRWLAAGKLTRKGPRKKTRQRAAAALVAASRKTPAQWVADVRAAYSLDATDEQLVTMAESALLLTRDPMTPAPLRLQAMGRFQGIVKQLSLVARSAVADSKPESPIPGPDPRKTFRVVRRSGPDPRRALGAVNE